MILSTKDLSIGYGKKVVKENINLQTDEGKLICLLGKNGEGKSTLLRTIAGLQEPLCGQIIIADKNIIAINNHERSKLLSLVLTDRIEEDNLTVFELVALGRYPYTSWSGKLKEEDSQKVLDALRHVNMLLYKDRTLREISDGEKQRAIIAKALAQDTPLVLLDEPTSHLDLSNRIEIIFLLRNLSIKTGKTFILSTHELDLAIKMADYIWLMEDHKIHTGVPEDLLLNGIFAESFANPNFNFDTNDGHYQIIQPQGKLNVSIHGANNDDRTKWLRRAFVRCGIVDSPNTETKVQVSDEGYIIKDNKFETIEEVLGYINQLPCI